LLVESISEMDMLAALLRLFAMAAVVGECEFPLSGAVRSRAKVGLNEVFVFALEGLFVKMPWSKEFVGATVLVVGTGCTVTSGYGGGGLIAFWMSSWRSL
jgi:hypothetical protein